MIYVKPALIELKENGFLSIEEKRQKKNVKLQWIAIICAIVFPFLNTLYSSCKGTKIYSEDLENIESKLDFFLQAQYSQESRIGCVDSTILYQYQEKSNDSTIIE